MYRNLTTVTQKDLDIVKCNFKWVADQLDYFIPPHNSLIVILMGSPSDEEHCRKIAKHAKSLGLKVQLRVSSAHKGTQETLRILAEYESSCEKVCLFLALKTNSKKCKNKNEFFNLYISICTQI